MMQNGHDLATHRQAQKEKRNAANQALSDKIDSEIEDAKTISQEMRDWLSPQRVAKLREGTDLKTISDRVTGATVAMSYLLRDLEDKSEIASKSGDANLVSWLDDYKAWAVQSLEFSDDTATLIESGTWLSFVKGDLDDLKLGVVDVSETDRQTATFFPFPEMPGTRFSFVNDFRNALEEHLASRLQPPSFSF